VDFSFDSVVVRAFSARSASTSIIKVFVFCPGSSVPLRDFSKPLFLLSQVSVLLSFFSHSHATSFPVLPTSPHPGKLTIFSFFPCLDRSASVAHPNIPPLVGIFELSFSYRRVSLSPSVRRVAVAQCLILLFFL